jgi:hypothetical protein
MWKWNYYINHFRILSQILIIMAVTIEIYYNPGQKSLAHLVEIA